MIEFPLEGRDIVRFFRGLTFSSPGEDTWLVATVEGYPVGWARRISGRIKSYAPRWLRQF
jgi:NOL1/NOP2/fmu family ribosome biogenesis protein